MFEIRKDEPDYALLKDKNSQVNNQYGNPIETVLADNKLRDHSLNINGDGDIGTNPNRYKQHGFYFNADNCIACHACEAACSEKNDNPAHIAFRSVGFVEGGTYPDYQRLNISMACNHCDDPVCLKGCPTRAYTKFAEYGAVLQDPDICFGCGYCTWVCPYNAPQLDPVKGEVSKCNMCVDRLEVGLKPACVTACLGSALDFGVIENIPEGRSQAKTDIPGFPRTDITKPNIRFQQTRKPQRDMNRVDNTALKYHRDDSEDRHVPTLDPKHGFKREWNLARLLGSHENAHIAFTLSVQMIMGSFLLLMLGQAQLSTAVMGFIESSAYLPTLLVMLIVMSFGLFKLNMHLGKPHRFYRGFYNLKLSPVSREIAGVSAFFGGLFAYSLLALFDNTLMQILQQVAAILAVLGVGLGGYYMYKLYRIPARPFWDHWHTGASFAGTALSLGSLVIVWLAYSFSALTAELGQLLLLSLALGLGLEALGLLIHAKDMRSAHSEGAASFYEQISSYGYAYWLRNSVLAIALMITVSALLMTINSPVLWVIITLLSIMSSIIGRALFYVLVIPTTMPGAFFWRNKSFVDHARESGLADMPQLGVAYEQHHAFKVDELIDTIRSTTLKEKIEQAKRILTG